MKKEELITFNFKLTDENDVGFFWKAKLIEEVQSEYQNIKVIEHERFGKALLLDNYVMFCEYDENKYHELITYPAIEAMKKCNDVLVVGGGDTLTVKRLMASSVKTVKMVEIDRDVFEVCKKHFPVLVNAYLKDSRLNILFDDAIKVINEDKNYDLILLDIQDCRDEEMTSSVLFSDKFYSTCKNKLNHGGVLVAQISCPYLLQDHFNKQVSMLKKLFKHTFTYGAYMHCYGMHQYFIACSNETVFNPKEISKNINLSFDWDYKLFN